jgi:hypothetical protein
MVVPRIATAATVSIVAGSTSLRASRRLPARPRVNWLSKSSNVPGLPTRNHNSMTAMNSSSAARLRMYIHVYLSRSVSNRNARRVTRISASIRGHSSSRSVAVTG